MKDVYLKIKKQYMIKAQKHQIYIIKQNKVALN